MDMKNEIRQKLLSSIIAGRCTQKPEIHFSASLCSGSRIIRFSTQTLESILPVLHNKAGAWKTGILLQYEIQNDGTALLFQLSLSASGLNPSRKKHMAALLQSAGAADVPDEKGIIAIRRWNYEIGTDMEKAHAALDEIFDCELPFFEKELQLWQKDPRIRIRPFPELDEPEELIDGKEIHVRANRFERNREARRKCISHYGTACQICGFDFGRVYGAAFAGKIEVHHIVPLSEIREEYVVDPVRDLIPVCSNCHTALHSKKGGCYLPNELRDILRRSEYNMSAIHSGDR